MQSGGLRSPRWEHLSRQLRNARIPLESFQPISIGAYFLGEE